MVNVIGKVGFAFLAELGITVGITAFFTLLLVNTINWDLGPVAVSIPLAIGAAVGGFIGGLIAHSVKKGVYPGLLTSIVVFTFLLVLVIVRPDFMQRFRLPWLYEFGTYNIGFAYFLWFLPVIIVAAGTIPSGMIGGHVSAKYVRVRQVIKKKGYQKKKKPMDIFKTPLFVVIFILSWVPLIVPLLTPDDNVYKDFSAWNYDDTGTSSFRLELVNEGYTNVKSCITSYSMLSRIEEPFVILSLGPNKFYNPISDVPFMIKFLKLNGSMLLCHEQGSTQWLMYDMFIASLPLLSSKEITRPFPFMFFGDGLLKDNVSYHTRNDLPVLQGPGIGSHPVMNGIDKIVLNHASGMVMLPGMDTALGWQVLASSTNLYSWVDKGTNDNPNGDGRFNRKEDRFDVPFMFNFALQQYKIENGSGVVMGGFPIPVVAATEFGSDGQSRVIVTSDASIYTNQMINLAGYKNKQFALNCVEWLTRGNKSRLIVFDEAHLRPDGLQDASPAAIFGQFLDYVAYSSSNWFMAPFYPFLALSSIKKWLPKTEEQIQKEQEKKRRKEEKKARKSAKRSKRDRRVFASARYSLSPAAETGEATTKKKKKPSFIQQKSAKKIEGILKRSTYFTQKLNWYLEQSKYNGAIELLYNRVRRLIGQKIGENASTETVIHAIIEKYPNVEHDKINQFFKTMDRVLAKTGKKRLSVTRLESFESIYFQMVQIQEYLNRI